MEKKTYYQVGWIHWSSEPDDLEEGCNPDQSRSNYHSVHIQADDLDGLLHSLFDWINAEYDLDAVELDACDEPGRIDIQVMEHEPAGDAIPREDVNQALRDQSADRVKCRLTGETFIPSVWLTCYTVYVERVTVETDLPLEGLLNRTTVTPAGELVAA